MKIAYLGTQELHFDTERPVKFVLVGQRNEDNPKEAMAKLQAFTKKVKDAPKPTDDEMSAIDLFWRRKQSGYFNPKALNWWETEEQAEADKANWPDFTNFRLIGVGPTV